MQHVADDGDRQPGEILLVVADGVEIEQSLGRVGVAPVAGVDNVQVAGNMARDQMRRAALRVPHHEHVRMHGREIVYRVEQGLALGMGGHGDVEVDDVGRQALGGDLERGAGAGGGLEE